MSGRDPARQMVLFGNPTQDQAPHTRTWADVRKGDRFAHCLPGSAWNGNWAVRRIGQHRNAPYLLLVDLVDDTGRKWPTSIHRSTAVPGLGFTPLPKKD